MYSCWRNLILVIPLWFDFKNLVFEICVYILPHFPPTPSLIYTKNTKRVSQKCQDNLVHGVLWRRSGIAFVPPSRHACMQACLLLANFQACTFDYYTATFTDAWVRVAHGRGFTLSCMWGAGIGIGDRGAKNNREEGACGPTNQESVR